MRVDIELIKDDGKGGFWKNALTSLGEEFTKYAILSGYAPWYEGERPLIGFVTTAFSRVGESAIQEISSKVEKRDESAKRIDVCVFTRKRELFLLEMKVRYKYIESEDSEKPIPVNGDAIKQAFKQIKVNGYAQYVRKWWGKFKITEVALCADVCSFDERSWENVNKRQKIFQQEWDCNGLDFFAKYILLGDPPKGKHPCEFKERYYGMLALYGKVKGVR